MEKQVRLEKERVAAEMEKVVKNIEREKEEEKRVIADQAQRELEETVEVVVAEAREQIEEVEYQAEAKLVQLQVEEAEAESKELAEEIEDDATAEAEISEGVDQAAAERLRDAARAKKKKRADERRKRRLAAERRKAAVAEEARALKAEIEKGVDQTVQEKTASATDEMESKIASVQEDTEDLVEQTRVVQQLEQEKVDLEGEIVVESLEQEKREAEEDRDIAEDMGEKAMDAAEHPRTSKKDRVRVKRTKKANGSSFVKIDVPSDLSPGAYDTVSMFVSKEVSGLLARYRRVHAKISADGSLRNLSPDDKRALALAGAEFKKIREQYVEQRTGGVVARREQLAGQLRVA